MAHTFNHNDIEAVIHRDSGIEVAGGGRDGAALQPEPRLGCELEESLSERHMAMIALSANIGFGMTINSGIVLRLVGPIFTVLTYVLSAVICWILIPPFSEMTTTMNIFQGPMWEIPTTFFSSSLGLASSWMYLFTWATIYPNECGVVGHIFTWNYVKTWPDVRDASNSTTPLDVDWDIINPNESMYHWARWGSLGTTDPFGEELIKAAVITLALLTTLGINSFRVRIYAELEYAFGVIKIIGLSILIVAMACLWGDSNSLRGGGQDFAVEDLARPTKGYGFYMGSGDSIVFRPSSGVADLMAMWTAIRWVFFGFLGPESIVVTSGEAKFRTMDIKPATRKTLVRIFSLYLIMILSVVINVSRKHPNLLALYSGHPPSSANSPIMIALVEAAVRGKPGYKSLAHFANVLFAFSAWSCACSALYISSRTLHALAVQGRLPTRYLCETLRKTNKRHVPQNALYACFAFGLIGYLASGKDAREALDALCSIGTICWLTVMAVLALCFPRFLKVIDYYQEQGIPDPRTDRSHTSERYPYRTKAQPWRSWIGFSACSLLIFFGGFYAFLWVGKDGSRVGKALAANYIAILLFITLYIGHKFAIGTIRYWKIPEPKDISIQGWVALSDEDLELKKKRRSSFLRRVLYWFK